MTMSTLVKDTDDLKKPALQSSAYTTSQPTKPKLQTRKTQVNGRTRHQSVNRAQTAQLHRPAPPAHSKENGWGMLDMELQMFGDRCPKGYQKLSLLGKGGVAVVWLCLRLEDSTKVALKQFPKKSNTASAAVEVNASEILAESNHPGLRHISKLLQIIDDAKDIWLAYEVGAQPLGKHLFDVKGEFFHGERIYSVIHKEFYQALGRDHRVLKDFIYMLAEAFDCLQESCIVHADVKPDNVLIDFDGQVLHGIKLIDFGSAFIYSHEPVGCDKIAATTPEYLAPEVLHFLENKSKHKTSAMLCQQQQPWSYDMWSLGVILLEIMSGIPVWMSLKCRTVPCKGRSHIGPGILGVQGRVNAKILSKQGEILKTMPKSICKNENYGLSENALFINMLVRILDRNAVNRISPQELMAHPWLR